MTAAQSMLVTALLRGRDEPMATTLLDLVRAVSEVATDEREVVATVTHLLRSGRVRLTGNFRDARAEDFC
jgi:hypothetical protein